MTLDETSPTLVLRECVRCYQRRRARISGAPVVFPVAARPEQFLEFYLKDRYFVRPSSSGSDEMVPRAVAVGPRTGPSVELVLRDNLEVFTIQFQPTGFFRLFGAPMRELADRAYEARSVIGPLASQIEQRLGEAADFLERTRVADRFLSGRLAGQGSADSVTLVANRFLLKRGALNIDEAAARAGLSIRQFERRFAAQVGLPPKRYARIVRFNAALEAKAIAPGRKWTDIAYELGYFDQMHMIRDFERFAGETPTAFERRLDALAWS